jgi:hypothetical protein
VFVKRIRKKFIIGITVTAALLFTVLIPQGSGIADAQDKQQLGWLDGFVDRNGEPDCGTVTVLSKGKQVYRADIDESLNGLYSIRDMRPGIYEIQVRACQRGWRPQRIFGVVVKPGVRSILNVTLHEGKELEEIGQPEVPTQPVINISEELTHLQGEIDKLKNQ